MRREYKSRKLMTPEELREHVRAINRDASARKRAGIRINAKLAESSSDIVKEHHSKHLKTLAWRKWWSKPENREKHNARNREYMRKQRKNKNLTSNENQD